MFTKQDYEALHSLVFQDDYPGYRKEVKEIPNGDGKVDADKRYAHVATKYLSKSPSLVLLRYLERAHELALEVARALGVPAELTPRFTECALRVLEYPSGVGGHKHTDFDLFTLSLYRSEPARLKLDQDSPVEGWLDRARDLSPGLHIGELGELVGLGEATRHHVEPSTETQYSIVYFALPSPDAVVATGSPLYGSVPLTAGAWLAERYARSRVSA